MSQIVYIIMIFAIALLAVLLISAMIALQAEHKKRIHFQRLQKERGLKYQEYMRYCNAVLRNIHAYVILVDREFKILNTNLDGGVYRFGDSSPLAIGDVFCCYHVFSSGHCAPHGDCKKCDVCRAITRAFVEKRGFANMKVSLNLVVGEGQYNACEALLSGSYIEVNGEESMVLTMRDITELVAGKRGNENLEQVVGFTSSIAQIGFASLNLITEEELITPVYGLNLCEHEEEKATNILRNFRHVHSEDREELLRFMESASKGKIEPLCKEVRVMTHIDSWKWVKLYLIQKEYNPEEDANTVYSLSIDIDRQKIAEEKLVRQKVKAEEADKSKSVFLANMSHEIRTPLNAIVGFSELIAIANTEDEKKQYLNILKSNNDMLLQLINDILDVAKIEAGTLEFVYTDVDINLMMCEMQQLFEVKLETDEVQIVAELPLPTLMLSTDRGRLMQVLFNFMSNAIKFTGSGTIRLGYEPFEEGYRFYVADTGIGLSKKMLDSVFERFARFHKEKKGNGLGLAISKTIIEKLGGEIGADSVEGHGSTFWFTLPGGENTKAVVAVAEENPGEVDIPNPGERTGHAKKEYKILIAEDMDDNYNFCEVVLSKKHRVLRARNGEEAITMYLQNSPDVILMDLKMPEVDGYQATEVIRQLSATVPIIALTAFAYSEDKERVMKSGFTDYITKPVSIDLLVRKIDSYCK